MTVSISLMPSFNTFSIHQFRPPVIYPSRRLCVLALFEAVFKLLSIVLRLEHHHHRLTHTHTGSHLSAFSIQALKQLSGTAFCLLELAYTARGFFLPLLERFSPGVFLFFREPITSPIQRRTMLCHNALIADCKTILFCFNDKKVVFFS